MYVVTIERNGVETEIHGYKQKLANGTVTKGINAIDAFSFSIFPSNAGFHELYEFKTLVKVWNSNRNRYEFYGRVLYCNPTMSEKGLLTKEVTCESYMGFLCDSRQKYVAEKNWTVRGLLKQIIDVHNSQVEDYKKIKIGTVTVTDPNDNLYVGIQRRNTWDTLNEKLVNVLGGELRFRVENDGIYLDYLTEIGETKQTAIELSRNMKSVNKENDPTQCITRFIPYGHKLSDDSEERLTIASVNNGKEYIDDEDAIALYGIHVGDKEWDDVTEAANLLSKARSWLAANNKALVKYSITALDLSLIGMDIDDFDVGNTHPIKNHLLDIDDSARIIKKSINICEENKSTIEVGDVFKQLTDIIIGNANAAEELSSSTSSLGHRMSSAEGGIREMNDQILLKASKVELDETKTTLNNAIVDINANEAKILLLAGVKTYDEITNERSLRQAYIDIDGANSRIDTCAENITLNADKITIIAEDIVEINKIFAGSAKALYIKTASLNADTANIDAMSFDGDYVSWKERAVCTGGSISPESTKKTVVDSAGNAIGYVYVPTSFKFTPTTRTIYYMGKNSKDEELTEGEETGEDVS